MILYLILLSPIIILFLLVFKPFIKRNRWWYYAFFISNYFANPIFFYFDGLWGNMQLILQIPLGYMLLEFAEEKIGFYNLWKKYGDYIIVLFAGLMLCTVITYRLFFEQLGLFYPNRGYIRHIDYDVYHPRPHVLYTLTISLILLGINLRSFIIKIQKHQLARFTILSPVLVIVTIIYLLWLL